MATGTGKWYSLFFKSLADKKVNLVTATIDSLQVTLHTSAYSPNQDTHQFASSLSAEVAQANNYTTGGKTLASVTWAYDTTNNVWMLDANDTTWTTSTITARYAVVWDSVGASNLCPLIAYIDFGTDVASSGGDFSITFDTAGIAKLTVS